ncbi:hypothetical protein [Variovorax paradoxus]|uniref:hypothetical protein n=1 Tax=Variovorax paradoxus TaxID=34073 RepID=UPI0019330E0D|nr:hypothetical protein INQ48_25110 [Variovorax paradoxus]
MPSCISRRLATVIDWAGIGAECALLLVWKVGDVPGAGNVLSAWIVVSGVFGVGMLLPAVQLRPEDRPLPYAYGWRYVRAFGIALAVALIWCGHGLLGFMCVLGEVGVEALRRREREAWHG